MHHHAKTGLGCLTVSAALLLNSCAAVRLTGETVVLTGKVASTAVKTTETAVTTTGRLGSAGVRHLAGKHAIKLEREGDSLFVKAIVNRRHKARLLLDTGATSVQISPALARRIGVNPNRGETVRCTLADGSTVAARLVTLRELRLGKMRAKKVMTACMMPV